jgi:lipoprotein-releasing system permease protein
MKNQPSLLPFFIAWRYLGALPKKSSLSTMLIISFLSILIGSFSLTLVSAIMHGFEHAMHEKLRGINAPLTIHTMEGSLAVDALNALLKNEFPEIIATAAHSTHHALVYGDSRTAAPLVVLMHGIFPDDEQHVSSLVETIIVGDTDLTQVVTPETILIGKSMALSLNKTVGETITLAYSNQLINRNNTVTFETHTVSIGGIFESGIDDIDATYLFAHQSLMEELFDDAPLNTLSLSIQPRTDESALAAKIEKRIGIDTYSWQSLYPAIIAALALEKYTMFWILALISLVASANIMSLLFMLITQKRADIALLLSLGMKPSSIRAIFIIIGSLLAHSACMLGIGLACIASFLINHYQLIALPDSYYINYVQAHMTLAIPLSVLGLECIITFIALFFATRSLGGLSISMVLKSE